MPAGGGIDGDGDRCGLRQRGATDQAAQQKDGGGALQ
jgi:hypothetical protein